MKKTLSEHDIAQLRKRLQTCERRIIETANWDDNYFYDESLPSEQCELMIALLRKRQRTLNQMCVYTDNEVKRMNVLNAMLSDATRQMNQDLSNMHIGRIAMPSMEQYNGNTWFETRLSYDYYAGNSVIQMPEDAYYGSQFDRMLELLCAEEGCLTYSKGCIRAFQQLGEKVQSETKDGEWGFCPALYDLINLHLYSVPDVLRMNRFTIKLDIQQMRTFAAS